MLNNHIWLPKHVYGRYWVVSVPIWRPIKVPNGPKIGLIAFFITSNVLVGLYACRIDRSYDKIGSVVPEIQMGPFGLLLGTKIGPFWYLRGPNQLPCAKTCVNNHYQ